MFRDCSGVFLQCLEIVMESIQHFYNVARRKLTPVSDVLASETHDCMISERKCWEW